MSHKYVLHWIQVNISQKHFSAGDFMAILIFLIQFKEDLFSIIMKLDFWITF